MEAELYRGLKKVIQQIPHPRKKDIEYSDKLILLVVLWAFLHERPISWACKESNWPRELDHPLPSNSCMSRRTKELSFLQLVERVLQMLADLFPASLVKSIDSYPLRTGNYSHDVDARRGQAAGEKARGYKLHGIFEGGVIRQWILMSMNVNDQVAAQKLLPRLTGGGYVVGDNGYDANPVYASAEAVNHQLVAPPRKTNAGVRDLRRNRASRIRSLDLCATPLRVCGVKGGFGRSLLKHRGGIERGFSQLSFCGLGALPPFVRHPRRVALWTAIKIMIRLYKTAKNARLTA